MLKNYFQKKLNEKISRGVIVLNKEAGITSHDEVARLRRIFNTKRVGHSGTLDPKVTGVLVCGLGRGTKVLEYVLLSEKVYECEIIFHKKIARSDLAIVLKKFTGMITQMPPVKSSVKREEREREVYELKLTSFASDGRSANFTAAVERGTYIRKLCHDMGQSLPGAPGAHMGDLQRTKAGPFSTTNSVLVKTQKLEELKVRSRGRCNGAGTPALPSLRTSNFLGWWYLFQLGKYIYPLERLLVSMPKVVVYDEMKQYILNGAPVYVPGVISIGKNAKIGTVVGVVNSSGVVWAIGKLGMEQNEFEKTHKGTVVELNKVLI